MAAKPMNLVIGEHIAGGIGGARDAKRCHVLGYGEPVEINMILETVSGQKLDARLHSAQKPGSQPLVHVTDIFRHERKQDCLSSPVAEFPGQEIEKKKERCLSARCNGNIFRSEVPSKLLPKQICERGDEARISDGRIIVCHHPIKRGRIGQNRRHAIAPNRLHFRNVRRVATTKHPHRPMCTGHCAPEIVHQFLDPAATGKPLAEKGFLKHSRNLTTERHREHRVNSGNP